MTSDRKAQEAERDRRRADALRANLRRRKEQSRERARLPADRADAADDAPG